MVILSALSDPTTILLGSKSLMLEAGIYNNR